MASEVVLRAGEGAELRWVRPTAGGADGHTGISFDVLDDRSISGCRVVLVRLHGSGGVRHFVLHAACILFGMQEPGLFFGLLGFGSFRECPVLGSCWYRVLASCDEACSDWVEAEVRKWLAGFVAGFDGVREGWNRLVLAWRALGQCLGDSGVAWPGLEEVVRKAGAAAVLRLPAGGQ